MINAPVKKISNINEFRLISYITDLIFDNVLALTIKFHEQSSTANIKPFFFSNQLSQEKTLTNVIPKTLKA